MRSLSVVVPVYNAAQSLSALAERLAAVLPTISDRYELILVEDDSRDQSWDVIRELVARYPWVRGIKLMRNSGQHSALLCGIRAAHYGIIVTLDDDLQHPPEQIATLLAKLDEGYDVVYGTPQREQHGLWRDLASRVTKLALQSAMGAETARQVSAFRVFRTQLRRAFRTYRGPFVSIDVLLTWGASRFAAVPVPHHARAAGASNYTLRKLFAHTMNMATGFSEVPLQLASWLGFGFTIFGVVILLYVLGRYVLEGGSVPGFPFLASIIALFSGVQLFVIGIIGEYLARMHFRLMDRPAYTVEIDTAAPEPNGSADGDDLD